MIDFLSESQISEILKTAQKSGAEFAEIFIEDKKVCTIGADGGKIEQLNMGEEQGLGLRVINGENIAYASTNDLDYANLLSIAQKTAQAAQGDCEEVTLDFSYPLTHQSQAVIRPESIALEDKIAQIKACDQAALNTDENITRTSVSYSDITQNVLIASTAGRLVCDERIRTRLSVNAIARDENSVQTGFDSLGGTIGYEILNDDAALMVGENAARRAVSLLSAKPCPGGKMPVVMASSAGGTMVHEACGHGLEGDLVEKGMSAYAGKLGKQVADSRITVVDDATLDCRYGSYAYDDEGFTGRRNVLIENGILQSYMYDYHTAKKVGAFSTANGRRQSYRHKPVVRMSNTLIMPGTDDPEEIIAAVEHGLLVTKMGGGQVNTLNGDYVFDVAEGFMIINGEIAYQMRGATLAGNGPKSLNDVEMVGSDLGFAIGTCGKSGQSAPVADAQPTLKINNLVVGGTAGEITIERR